MWIAGVQVADELGGMYRTGNVAELLPLLSADDPSCKYLRALCLASIGRFQEAETALSGCEQAFPVAVRIQRSMLDVQRHARLEESARLATEVAQQTELSPALRGVVWHVRGLAEGKLRNTSQAAAALLESLRWYREADDRWGVAQVRDTLGSVEAARGRMEQAVHCYAMALVDKSTLGDRLGMALTLGNLGRVQLRVGRFTDAIECFERDREICQQLGDVRGLCRMHNDLGRACLAEGDWNRSEEELMRGAELAVQHAFSDIAFYCHKDLAVLRIEQRQYQEAHTELQRAASHLSAEGAAYLRLAWQATSAQLRAAQHDPRAIEDLQEVVEAFHQADLPDWEIPTRIVLAEALRDHQQTYAAERCLLAGLRLAHQSGYRRYLIKLNEAITQLDLCPSAEMEHGKQIVDRRVGVNSPLTSSATTGNYLVRAELGSGGFGTVYRAYDSQRGIEVALKMIRLGAAYDTKLRGTLWESTRNELAAASRVRHPGVVRIYAVGEDESGDLYICQELIDGGSLRQVINEWEFRALAEPLAILAGVAHALEALHAAQIFHRDLKPANVLMRNREQPVVIDFGIAHLKPRGWFDKPDFSGTLEYMAPEQAAGKSVDARADLYALGVMMYEWFAGRRPIKLPSGDWSQRAAEIQKQMPKPMTIYCPDLPPRLVTLVHQLLQKKPRRRPSHARDVAEQLETLCHEVR